LSTEGVNSESSVFAMKIADGSHAWYETHAIRSRRLYKVTETSTLIVAAAIPVSAAINPESAIVPAVLGALVSLLAGCRAIYHWQDNYLRFSRAREAVEAERRLYRTRSGPYQDDLSRDALLVAMVTKIEQDEMAGWIKVAASRPAPVAPQ
jgi:hypothetical protein